MPLAYDYITSRSFWRLVYPPERSPSDKVKTPPLELFVSNSRDVRNALSSWVTQDILNLDDGRVHVLAFSRNNRRVSKFHSTYVWPHALPDGSLLDLGTGAFVSSPEFTFLQIAATHSIIQTVAYGDEICGRYAFDPFNERGLRKRIPLTNKAKLSSYLDSIDAMFPSNYPGVKKARRALQYIIEESASPMETVDEMLLCLPYKLGGYGLPKPHMNKAITLSPSAARIAKKSVCYGDMCWNKPALIDIEHQGLLDHDEPLKFEEDRQRINGIKAMGYEVIELTNKQVKDFAGFESIAMHLAKRLDKWIYVSKRGGISSRVALRKELFEWNQAGGRKMRYQ